MFFFVVRFCKQAGFINFMYFSSVLKEFFPDSFTEMLLCTFFIFLVHKSECFLGGLSYTYIYIDVYKVVIQ